jgi:hypothetical protein
MVRFDDFQMFSRRPQIYPNKVYAYKGYSFPHFNALGNEWKMSERAITICSLQILTMMTG